MASRWATFSTLSVEAVKVSTLTKPQTAAALLTATLLQHQKETVMPEIKREEMPHPAWESLTAEQRVKSDAEIQREIDSFNAVEAGPLSKLRSAGWVLDNVEPDIPYYVHGYLAPAWVTLLSGFQKHGKSTWFAAMAKALETGETFCGMKTRPAKIVWLTEEPESTMRDKVAKFGIGREQVHFLFWHDNKQLSWEEWIKAGIRACKASKANLLVVDTFSMFSHIVEENTPEQGHAVAKLAGEIRNTEIAALLLVHNNKNQRTYRGHSSLGDVPEIKSTLTWNEKAGPNTRRIESTGRMSDTMWKMDVTLEGDSYKSSTVGDQDKTNRDLIEGMNVSSACAFIEEKGGKVKTSVFVEEHCGGDHLKANRILKAAKKRGKLDNKERGYWSWTSSVLPTAPSVSR